MALTGTPDLPLGPPDGLVDEVARLGSRFPGLNALELLGERAALMGLWRRGTTSCGGSCRLMATADGWVAVSLPRAADVESVPAWLELNEVPGSEPAVWAAVARSVAERASDEVLARAQLLGLPVAVVGEASGAAGILETPLGTAPARDDVRSLLVIDLSALWAGPLCGELLARCGARVVKVESTARPDGARRGPPAFFDLLNGHKRSVALDFTSPRGAKILGELVHRADIVIEASRPRALEQFGITATEVLRSGRPQVWVSITGHGRSADRIAFGDDAAAAGGLVVWSGSTPMFCADAVGDPLTGLTSANACLDAVGRGGRWLIDVSMAGVCAASAGPTAPTPPGLDVAEPRARDADVVAPELGADTSAVLAELGIAP
jgi:hypothetical protein